jgi:predicted ATPase/DNA-binding SARP family transcriptional activator
MEGTIRLQLLGTVQVERDGERVEGFRSRKALGLLGYLAAQGQPVPRERLADLLWEDKPEAKGRTNLSWVLGRISALVPGLLEANRHAVHFQPAIPCQLDIDVFDEFEAAKDAASLAEAAKLYRGDSLEGLYLEGCAEFELWVVGERERWRKRVAAVLRELIARHSRRGEYREGLQFARRLLELEPWHEEVHRQVMRLPVWSGQRGVALAQYETCHSALAEELGAEPEEETVVLYERIRDGEELPPPVPLTLHNLPAPVTPFVGREAELAEMEKLLQDPACRHLSLVGSGGSGKTRLALEAAAAQVGNYEHGVYFVSLAALRSVDRIVPAVAQAIGFPFHSGGEPRQQLLGYLKQKRMLLVLDNCEHLLSLSAPSSGDAKGEGAGEECLVTDILRAAPEVRTLTTSRARLSLQGEHLFLVDGMVLPPLETSDYDGRDDAVELFSTSARRAQPGFEVTADSRADVVRICRLVEGMPLGILLAAAWTRMLAPSEIVGQIEQSVDFLAREAADVPPRQRSMRSTISHSWSLLTKREREVFAALPVFRGGFTRPAAQDAAGALLPELAALVDKSLLHRDPAGRYEMHELLRQYAEEKLEQSPDGGGEARDRHCAYYIAALQEWWADLQGPRQRTALLEMETEIDNVRVAWDWATEQGQVEWLDQGLDGLCLFYGTRGRWKEGETASRMAADRLAGTEATADVLRTRARALTWQGGLKVVTEGPEDARALLQQSLAILERPELANQDTRREKAFALVRTGLAMMARHEDGRQSVRQSLPLYRALGDQWAIAHALFVLASTALNMGALGEARKLHEESLAIRRALGDQIGMADSLGQLGLLSWVQGQLEEGEALCLESLAIHQEGGLRPNAPQGLIRLGEARVRLGRLAEGLALLEESLAVYTDLADVVGQASANALVCEAKTHLGDYEQARVVGRAGLATCREADYLWGIGFAGFALGLAALGVQEHAEAQQLLQESAVAFREVKHRENLGWALAVLGYADRELSQPSQARQHLCEAFETATEIGVFMPMIYGLPLAALLLADWGQHERAVEIYALASRYGFVANSRWFEDVAGQHIAAIAAALPPKVIAAAKDRGRECDLDATVRELAVELEDQQRTS